MEMFFQTFAQIPCVHQEKKKLQEEQKCMERIVSLVVTACWGVTKFAVFKVKIDSQKFQISHKSTRP